MQFQSRKPQPSVLMRCLLQYFVFDNTGLPDGEPAKDLLMDDLEELVLPGDILIDRANMEVEAPHDDRFQIARRMESFVNKARDVRVILTFSPHALTSLSAAVLRLPTGPAHEPFTHKEDALPSGGRLG